MEKKKKLFNLPWNDIFVSRSTDGMRQSEEKYRTLFEESRDAIYITSREGKFVDANQAIVTMVKVYSNTVKAQVEKEEEIEGACPPGSLSIGCKPGKGGRSFGPFLGEF
jgi:hypothetical protein